MITAMAIDWYVPFEEKHRYYFVIILLGTDGEHLAPIFDKLTFATRKEAQRRAQELYAQWTLN
jgi:hypothetical protein